MNEPARASADRGDLQAVPVEQSLEIGLIDGVRCRRKDFDSIKAQSRGQFHAIGQPFMKNEWTAASLGREGDGDGAFHRSSNKERPQMAGVNVFRDITSNDLCVGIEQVEV